MMGALDNTTVKSRVGGSSITASHGKLRWPCANLYMHRGLFYVLRKRDAVGGDLSHKRGDEALSQASPQVF